MNRVYSVSDTSDLDPTYAEGLKAAVTAAVDYGFAAIALGEDRSEPPPPILLAQARLAARAGVSLDTVLRRYFAGHALLGDFLVEEAENSGLRGQALQSLLRVQAALFDRLLASVSEEHRRESRDRPTSADRWRSERVEQLLAGELVDADRLEYDLDGQHLGIIAKGPGSAELLGDLAVALDRRLLSVASEEEVHWAWLGGRRPVDLDVLKRWLASESSSPLYVATGEPAEGIAGWRFTHRQAKAALVVSLRSSESIVHYSDVAVLAAILQDGLLVAYLQDSYLTPLEQGSRRGQSLSETVRAYFGSGCQISSAAATLGTSRQTVTNRLNAAEKCLNRPLDRSRIELEVALRLEELQ